jgi:lipopolysaccharide transport system ATP-binding protein
VSTPAILVESVSKKFWRGQRHGSLRDAVASWFGMGAGRSAESRLPSSEFWALDDLNFRVEPGEAFGIIGPNGAGKSTTLKLLAGIMRPTAGTISIRGRVSALIEVGAGFHPDLTGRENVYLNASILGMPRSEVGRKFDEIVDFAGIRDFLDTPIKRYSSGMYARLGFAVAAHVDPEVLLVDEVLSVGDRVFRAKCMDKMRAFLKQGVAIVFVSHDLSAVSTFCDRGMVLASGKTVYAGPGSQAVAHYHEACAEKWMLPAAKSQALATVEGLRFFETDGTAGRAFRAREPVRIQFDVRFGMNMPHPSFGLTLHRASDRLCVFETSSTRMHCECPPATTGSVRRVRYQIHLNVPPGEYCVGYHVRDRDELRYAAISDDAARLMVLGEPVSGGIVDLAAQVEIETPEATAVETAAASV